MSGGVCLILHVITFEEEKGDGWGRAVEVQLKILRWINRDGRHARCLLFPYSLPKRTGSQHLPASAVVSIRLATG